MRSGRMRWGGLSLCCALTFGGCSSDSAPGSADTIEATPSVAGTVGVVTGSSQTVSVSFSSSDGEVTRSLVVNEMSDLPAGWSGPSSFDCATVSTGSGCVLNLKFAPSVAATGTLNLTYGYIDDAGTAKTGSIAIPYLATSNDNVVATVSPTGQVNAVVGSGSQTVSVAFTTDDGQPATSITVTTTPTTLPAGWAGPASFSCAKVTTGSGCLLSLSYAPSAAGSGTFTIDYAYKDDAGTAKTGSTNIAYAATTNNNIVGTVAPTGQINAVIGGPSHTVSVTFTTDDGNPATAFTVSTDLSTLPAGWSSTQSSLACESAGSGNGCQLQLTYAPSAAANGTLTLNYGYRDNSGTAKNGSINIDYAATAHNNVTGTASPSGQINAVVGTGAQAVSVNFTSDNGLAAGLALTTALTALPSGWTSSATSFACATVGTSGSTCQLPLTYAPTAAGTGTLVLAYGYTNDAGAAATGTVSIPYASTVHDTVSGAVTPSGTVGVTVGGSQAVTVVFTTSDGNAAGDLAIGSSGTGGLGSLPSGWSVTGGAGTFSCSSVSSGSGCELSLTYAPTIAGNGTVALDFTYTDNAGTAQAGTVSIAYVALAQHAYIPDYSTGLHVCSVNGVDGTLTGCQTTGDGFTGASGIAFFSGATANYAYVADAPVSAVYLCVVNSDGTLATGCTAQGAYFNNPFHMTVLGSTLYVTNQGSIPGGVVTACAISSTDGTLSNCVGTATGSGLDYAGGTTFDGALAFVAATNDGLFLCNFDSADAILSACTAAAPSPSFSFSAWSVVLSGTTAYIANGYYGVATCTLGSGGALSSCGNTSVASNNPTATGFILNGGHAYVSTYGFSGASHVYLCAASGISASTCADSVTDGSDSGFRRPFDVVIH